MTGETDLARMLATLSVEQRPGTFAYVAAEQLDCDLAGVAEAVIIESEGPTYVVSVEAAHELGHSVTFRAAWLTLTVHSGLDAVGLTAAVASRLAEADISCNMLAGFYHDHLLVPLDRAEESIALLTNRHRRPDET